MDKSELECQHLMDLDDDILFSHVLSSSLAYRPRRFTVALWTLGLIAMCFVVAIVFVVVFT